MEEGFVSAAVWHLGLTRDGQPKHPLMLAYSTPLQEMKSP